MAGNTEEAAEELEGGQEGDCLPMRYPVRLVCRDSPRSASIQEFETEPALADAGIGDDANDLSAPLHRMTESRLERRHLLVAADEA